MAQEEGKSVSAVVQEALELRRRNKLRGELRELQGFWVEKARERGLLTEEDLSRYLAE